MILLLFIFLGFFQVFNVSTYKFSINPANFNFLIGKYNFIRETVQNGAFYFFKDTSLFDSEKNRQNYESKTSEKREDRQNFEAKAEISKLKPKKRKKEKNTDYNEL